MAPVFAAAAAVSAASASAASNGGGGGGGASPQKSSPITKPSPPTKPPQSPPSSPAVSGRSLLNGKQWDGSFEDTPALEKARQAIQTAVDARDKGLDAQLERFTTRQQKVRDHFEKIIAIKQARVKFLEVKAKEKAKEAWEKKNHAPKKPGPKPTSAKAVEMALIAAAAADEILSKMRLGVKLGTNGFVVTGASGCPRNIEMKLPMAGNESRSRLVGTIEPDAEPNEALGGHLFEWPTKQVNPFCLKDVKFEKGKVNLTKISVNDTSSGDSFECTVVLELADPAFDKQITEQLIDGCIITSEADEEFGAVHDDEDLAGTEPVEDPDAMEDVAPASASAASASASPARSAPVATAAQAASAEVKAPAVPKTKVKEPAAKKHKAESGAAAPVADDADTDDEGAALPPATSAPPKTTAAVRTLRGKRKAS
jgi:hypothetical protein